MERLGNLARVVPMKAWSLIVVLCALGGMLSLAAVAGPSPGGAPTGGASAAQSRSAMFCLPPLNEPCIPPHLSAAGAAHAGDSFCLPPFNKPCILAPTAAAPSESADARSCIIVICIPPSPSGATPAI